MSVNIHNRRTRNLGFTLVEIMVVVGIIGTLSSVVTNSLNESREKARDSARIQQLHQIQKALNQYYSDTGRYPLNWNQYNETAIVTLPAGQPSGTAGACDGYLAGIPGGGVDTPGCPLCSHLTLPNPEAFTLSMQELVNAGYLPRVPRSQPNEPAICY